MKYFLGEAANYSKKRSFRQLFVHGSQRDSAALREYLASRYSTPQSRVLLYSTGRAALAAGIKALVAKNSQIVINGFTCQAVVEAVHAAGCTPVYADIEPETLHFDIHTLGRTLQKYPRAKAIIIQNTLGIPADQRLFSFARRHNLIIIEDLAHSAGRFYADGTECGTRGTATILSFGKGKAVDTISGGALILRADAPLKPPMRPPRLSDGLRARFYPLFAAIARSLTPSKLAKIWLGGLVKIRFIERSADARLDLSRRCSHWQAKLALEQLPALPRTPLRNFKLVQNREQLLAELAESNYFFSEIWYDCPISPARNYARWRFPESECPISTAISRHIINIPTIYSQKSLAPALKIIQKYEITPAEVIR